MNTKTLTLSLLLLLTTTANAKIVDTEIDNSKYQDYWQPKTGNQCYPLMVADNDPTKYYTKINVVVFPYSQTQSYETLKPKILSLFEQVFELEPFKTRKNEFNIWLHQPEEMQANPFTNEAKNYYLEKAKDCPKNYVVIMMPEEELLVPSSRSIYYGIAVVKTRYTALAHEFGGLIGFMHDEFLYGNPEVQISQPINCDTSPVCEKFSDFEQLKGCFSGCTRADLYKTDLFSILAGNGYGDYGIVDEYIINRRIDNQLQKNREYVNAPFPPVRDFSLLFQQVLDNIKDWLCQHLGIFCFDNLLVNDWRLE